MPFNKIATIAWPFGKIRNSQSGCQWFVPITKSGQDFRIFFFLARLHLSPEIVDRKGREPQISTGNNPLKIQRLYGVYNQLSKYCASTLLLLLTIMYPPPIHSEMENPQSGCQYHPSSGIHISFEGFPDKFLCAYRRGTSISNFFFTSFLLTAQFTSQKTHIWKKGRKKTRTWPEQTSASQEVVCDKPLTYWQTEREDNFLIKIE